MSKQVMVPIAGSTIELGPINFNLYANSSDGTLTLFCRSGFPITRRHKQTISRVNRVLFITSDDVECYLDYSIKRINDIVDDKTIRVKDKQQILQSVGKVVSERIFKNPRNPKAISDSKQYVKATVNFVLSAREAIDELFMTLPEDSYLRSHVINVSILCLLLGCEIFREDKEKLYIVGFGGLLQDIGMSKVPKSILLKKSELTEDEMSEVRQHTFEGTKLLELHNLPKQIIRMAKNHHERFDGNGYHEGLKGDKIDIFSRIGAVADTYDAITSPRVYRKGKMPIKALEEMSGESSKYDPVVFSALLNIVLRNEDLVGKFKSEYLHGGKLFEYLSSKANKSKDNTTSGK